MKPTATANQSSVLPSPASGLIPRSFSIQSIFHPPVVTIAITELDAGLSEIRDFQLLQLAG
jgi:hypothetical protein